MDDGGRQHPLRYGLHFHTQGFTVAEVEYLCSILTGKFGLHCWVKLNKGLPIIVVSGHSYDIIFGLISEFTHESMRFKFPTGSRTV